MQPYSTPLYGCYMLRRGHKQFTALIYDFDLLKSTQQKMNLIFNGCKNKDLIRSDGRKGGKREVDMSGICPEVL